MGTYQYYSVDLEKGCAVVLRPDRYVSFVTEADDYEGIDHFFSGFMAEQKLQNSSFGKELEGE
jgi:phenol 2-monooxygenase